MQKILSKGLSRRHLLSSAAALGSACALAPLPTRAQATTWNWAHKPRGIVPAANADIVIWDIPAAGGTAPIGDYGQVLLMRAPTTGPITGSISALGLRFKAVFLIGATWRRKGAVEATAPTGNKVLGGGYIDMRFAGGIGQRPVVFIANLDLGWHSTEPNKWGDFLAIGCPDQPVDIYFQKWLCPKGSYGFTDAENGSLGPHSDIIQAKNGSNPRIGNMWVADWDVAWGYQHLFGKPSTEVIPKGYKWTLKDCVFRANPPDSTIYNNGGTLSHAVYIHSMGPVVDDNGNNIVNEQIADGYYYGVELDNVTFMDNGTGRGIGSYLNPNTTPAGRVTLSGSTVVLPVYKAASNPYYVFRGPNNTTASIKYNINTTVVGAAEVGYASSLRTREDLRYYINVA